MSTSATTGLSKPAGSNKVPLGTFGYIRARTRQRAYNLVIRELRKAAIKQADLAKRMGKAPEVVSRLLSRPRNWELNTFSDLMFAISGAVVTFDVKHPLEAQGFKKREEASAATIAVPLSGEQPNRFRTTQAVAA